MADSSQSACPFCRIANGDPDGQMIEKLDGCVVFEPLNPVTRGHLLVVPIEHVADFTDRSHVLARAAYAASAVAASRGGDWNLITSAGRSATQTVRHLHLHLVPRVPGDGLRLPWTPNEKRAEHPWELQ